MQLLTGKGCIHIPGHKELSLHQDIIKVEVPRFVYIPLVNGSATDFETCVQVGDEVSIGTLLAKRKSCDLPLYSSVSGKVAAIEKRMHATKRMQTHIVIENDFKDQQSPLFTPQENLTEAEIVERMKILGLVGLGGSGFPTYIKYESVKDIDTILINGVECEPYLTADQTLMKKETKALFKGTRLLMKAAHAKKGIIAIKPHQDLIDALSAYQDDDVTIKIVKDVYPMGWERALVKEVLGRSYERLPAQAHCIVNNAATAISFAKSLETGLPLYERLICVSGDAIAHPGVYQVRLGTPVADVIKTAGGYCDDEMGYLIAGGPMMGQAIMNDMFAIFSYMNGLTLLKKKEKPTLACLRCGSCITHCPMHLQPVAIMKAQKANDRERLSALEVSRCISCGMCSYVCPSGIEVTDYVAKAKRIEALMRKKRGGH